MPRQEARRMSVGANEAVSALKRAHLVHQPLVPTEAGLAHRHFEALIIFMCIVWRGAVAAGCSCWRWRGVRRGCTTRLCAAAGVGCHAA